MNAQTDVKSAVGCPQIKRGEILNERGAVAQRYVEVDGTRVFTYKVNLPGVWSINRVLFSRIYTPLFRSIGRKPRSMLPPESRSDYNDYDSEDYHIVHHNETRKYVRERAIYGPIVVRVSRKGRAVVSIARSDDSYIYYDTEGKEKLSKGRGENKQTIVDYGRYDEVLQSNADRVVLLLNPEPTNSILSDYLNCFVGILSGDYIIPNAYEESLDAKVGGDAKVSKATDSQLGRVTIVNKSIYGNVRITTTSGRFYLQYTRNEDGVLVGEVARTRLMPYHEEPTVGEIEGCYQEGNDLTPVYFSYYDPAGSGRQITREEYVKIRGGVVYESVAVLPKELTGLLGF